MGNNGASDDLMDFFSAPAPQQQQTHVQVQNNGMNGYQQQNMGGYQQNMTQMIEMNQMNGQNGYQNPYGFQQNQYMQQPVMQQQVQQPVMQNGFGNYSDNPFSGGNSNPMPSNQMTFSAASLAERNRLKQLETRNTQNVHSNINGF